MDGIETLKEIRRSGKAKDAPSVALTANAVSGAREMYLAAGFTNYLSKPVDGEKLERMIKDILPTEKVEPWDDSMDMGDHSTTEAPGEEKKDLSLEHLAYMDEVDEQAGLKNCGSEEGYLSVLSVFHQTAKDKADENTGDKRKKTVLSMLKNDSDTGQIPVMFLTGHGDKESVLSVVGLNPVDYLLKTIDKDSLLEKLKHFFAKKAV